MPPKRPRSDVTDQSKSKAKKSTGAKARSKKQSRQVSSSESDTPQTSRNVLALVDNEASEASGSDHPASSPEPDMILAEISTTTSTIPQDLVHKILQTFFQKGTKISEDARNLATEYIEIFIKEAVVRSNLERADRDGAEKGGFIEVGDLEKIAAVLALDF